MPSTHYLIFLLLLSSCIPVSIAPNIETNKIVKTKSFKKNLPKGYGFVFEDPKDADEFYNFIYTKYTLEDQEVDSNVTIDISERQYFMSFYEREKTTKTINLIPIVADEKRRQNGNEPLFEDIHTSRTGTWYLIIMVYDTEIKDALNPKYPNQKEVIKYLSALQEEYLSTHYYLETTLKKAPTP